VLDWGRMASEIKPVSPTEAAQLVQEGALYLDVRSEPEFAAGHVPGALNVPLLHQGPGLMRENPEFLQVVESAFAKDEKLVIGCKSGGRSKRAAKMMAQAGYGDLSEMGAGFDGGRDAFGRPQPGWSKQNLPIETGAPSGQAYTDVKARQPRPRDRR
jgi:rhodanese-related sulfurtransferase